MNRKINYLGRKLNNNFAKYGPAVEQKTLQFMTENFSDVKVDDASKPSICIKNKFDFWKWKHHT